MVEAYFDVDLEVNGGGSRVGSGLVDDRHFYFWKSVFGCASASLFIARIVAKQLNVVAIYYSPMVHLRWRSVDHGCGDDSCGYDV